MELNVMLRDSILPHYLENLKKTPLILPEIINRNYYFALSGLDEEDKCYFDTAEWLKKYLQKDLSQVPLSLFGGLCDLGLSIFAANKIRSIFNGEIEQLDSIIYKRLKNHVIELNNEIQNMNETDFDTISGLSGIVNYCFLKRALFDELIEKILQIFIEKTDSKSGWSIPYKNMDGTSGNKYPDGYINLSMSHGVLGPLIIMAKAYGKGYRIQGLFECVNKIIEWYCLMIDDNALTIPCSVSAYTHNVKEFYERDSWSYGSTIIFYSLMNVAKEMGDDGRYNYFKEIAIRKFKSIDSLEKYKYISSTILNGYGGMLALLKQYNRKNNDKWIAKRINEIEMHVIEQYNPNSKYGFQHYEYKCLPGNVWRVERYDLDGFAYGALGTIMSLGNNADMLNCHLLL